MKKLRILALILCLLTVLSLTGCYDPNEDVGATIPLYLGTQVQSFDPATAYNDDAALQIIGMIFEGLTKLDNNGNVKPAMAESWVYSADAERDEYILEFTLRDTCWSDGRQVSADDFVFAWKRIMKPDFQSEACALLFDLKNARSVKMGDASIDDLGIYAASSQILQIAFERDIDYTRFLEYCASPALYPLREDAVSKEADWASNVSLLKTNGPFTVRSNSDTQLILERNLYYYRDVDNDSIKKYVTPYRLIVNYGMSQNEQLNTFADGGILYVGDMSIQGRELYADDADVMETMSTLTYFFNTTVEPFNDPIVRRALSMAIDRDYIASLLVFAKSSTGFVNSRVYNGKSGTSFREAGGTLFASNADIAAAKALLATTTVSRKSFTITIRPNEVDRTVADYCASVWKELGFDVSIRALRYSYYKSEAEYEMYRDTFTEAYRSGDFEVISIDWQALSTDAWTTLAPFATAFSGGAMDMDSDTYDAVPHITGYANAAYDALIEAAYAATDSAERLSKLHDAEALLAEEMPVMPIVEYQKPYLTGKILKKVGTTFWGYNDFSKALFKNYQNYEIADIEYDVK